MKYLLKYKLFEDHKETSDKISEIEKNAQKQTEDTINQYKELIDEMMYEISDDYHTESEINIKDIERSLDRYVKTYVDYKIKFKISEYVDFFKKLKEVVERLKDTYEISYSIDGLYETSDKNFQGQIISVITRKLPGRPGSYRYPFDFDESKLSIERFIRDLNILNKDISDIQVKILISF
jgi:hypothetical protein